MFGVAICLHDISTATAFPKVSMEGTASHESQRCPVTSQRWCSSGYTFQYRHVDDVTVWHFFGDGHAHRTSTMVHFPENEGSARFFLDPLLGLSNLHGPRCLVEGSNIQPCHCKKSLQLIKDNTCMNKLYTTIKIIEIHKKERWEPSIRTQSKCFPCRTFAQRTRKNYREGCWSDSDVLQATAVGAWFLVSFN